MQLQSLHHVTCRHTCASQHRAGRQPWLCSAVQASMQPQQYTCGLQQSKRACANNEGSAINRTRLTERQLLFSTLQAEDCCAPCAMCVQGVMELGDADDPMNSWCAIVQMSTCNAIGKVLQGTRKVRQLCAMLCDVHLDVPATQVCVNIYMCDTHLLCNYCVQCCNWHLCSAARMTSCAATTQLTPCAAVHGACAYVCTAHCAGSLDKKRRYSNTGSLANTPLCQVLQLNRPAVLEAERASVECTATGCCHRFVRQ